MTVSTVIDVDERVVEPYLARARWSRCVNVPFQLCALVVCLSRFQVREITGIVTDKEYRDCSSTQKCRRSANPRSNTQMSRKQAKGTKKILGIQDEEDD